MEVKLIPKTLNGCQRIKSTEKEEKEEDEVIEGEEKLLEPGLFQSGLVSGVSVSQGSGSNLWW